MRTVIGLTGYAGSGKDAFADALVARHGFVKINFADPLRAMADAINPIVGYEMRNYGSRAPMEILPVRYRDALADLGYTNAKKEWPELRRFLQTLGTDAVRKVLGEETWAEHWHRTITGTPDDARIVATDARFPNEAKAVRRLSGGLVIRVVRPGVDRINDHASEDPLDDRLVHWTLHNDGTLEDLATEADQMVTNLRLRPTYDPPLPVGPSTISTLPDGTR